MKMTYKFVNKIIVITGGARGIGYAIANNFLQKCVTKVILIDKNEKNGNAAVENLNTIYGKQRAEFYKGDVTTDLEILYKEIIENNETVDVMVNCAGVGEGPFVENTINVNVTALIKWSLKFHEYMRCDKSGKGGTIINVASIFAYKIIEPSPIYQATKFAVLGFSKSLGHDNNFSKFGVRVVAICPDFTESDLLSSSTLYLTDLHNDFLDYIKNVTFQKAEAVGKATVDVYETAKSGTAWEISRSNPLVLVP